MASGQIKIGVKVVRHARSVTFHLAEAAVPRELFRTILQRVHRQPRCFGVPDSRLSPKLTDPMH